MAKRGAEQEANLTGGKKGASGRRTLYQSLHLISLSKGILLGLILVVLSVPVGNAKEFQGQMREAQLVWEGVHIDGKKVPEADRLSTEEILSGQTGAAANMLVIMDRYPRSATNERIALEKARGVLKQARTPEEARQANDVLQKAMSAAIDALYKQTEVTDEDKKLVVTAVRTFNDYVSKLRVRVRDYDRALQKALDIYNDIPTRALFAKPEVYSPN